MVFGPKTIQVRQQPRALLVSNTLTELDEELGDDNQPKNPRLSEVIIRKPEDAEEYYQNDKAHNLYRLSAPYIDERDGEPITGNSPSTDDDDIPNSIVKQGLIDVGSTSVTNG